ncbi:cobalamin-dependent protein [Gymnodinialimonas sp. 2307UL20-7]
MADDRRDAYPMPATVAGVDVRRLAREAIRVLAGQSDRRPAPLRARLDDLCAAFLSEDEELRHEAIQDLRKDGVTIPEIIDYVIPEVARILGQRWADDELSFAEVSIGSARLQECVRSLIARDISATGDTAGTNAPRILMIIPRPEDHTLGTFVAADQFRRYGYAVDIAVDTDVRQLANDLRTQRYVMVGITIGGRRTLASTKELVEKIRAMVTRVTPIAIGGSFVSVGTDLKQTTGADHVAVSAMDALMKCGLDIARADPSQKTVPSHEEQW